ncbi:MAG TPA: hypothetical protein VEJ45_04045 [Candidatus Acidoferrales bacterium]|nr:hypothetical protein [Candidatus Acidoferrales bacterium]
MSNEQTPNAAAEHRASERCACHEVLDQLGKYFDISPAVRQHLANSRVEFLKAIRAVIDHRIERLSATAQRGSTIAVE